MPNVHWKTPDDGQRNCPKHVEFIDKNKFGKLVRLLVLLKKKIVTMHGHMNVKFILSWFPGFDALYVQKYSVSSMCVYSAGLHAHLYGIKVGT